MAKFHFPQEPLPGEPSRRFDALGYPKLTADERDSLREEGEFATFWFFDKSLGGGTYCFNSPNISLFDYRRYMEVVKELSGYQVSELLPGNPIDDYLRRRNFHIVRGVNKYPRLCAALRQLFGLKGDTPLNDETCPLLYQIGLYNADECQEPEGVPSKAPRVFFRLTPRGSFSVFLLDLYHELCPAENRSGRA